MPKILQLDSRDNVLIALTDLRQGETVEHNVGSFRLLSGVPAKHKFATEDLISGARVTMYGVQVGRTSQPVLRGELLTTANLHHQSEEYREQQNDFHWEPPDVSRWKQRKFMGYARSGGQIGTRTYWLVVRLFFCETRNILNLKQASEEELGCAPPQLYRSQVAELVEAHREGRPSNTFRFEKTYDTSAARVFPNIDGIKFLLHEGGCGGTREDSNNLCGLIAGYINHPNVAGATVLSLGCQHAQTGILRQEIRRRNPNFSKPLFILA